MIYSLYFLYFYTLLQQDDMMCWVSPVVIPLKYPGNKEVNNEESNHIKSHEDLSFHCRDICKTILVFFNH